MRGLSEICATAVFIPGFSATSLAGYTIDADLSDWGVTPFSDWVPDSSSADYWETNDWEPAEYYPDNYEEFFEFEAIYFDNDGQNLYFAIVTSFPMGAAYAPDPLHAGGDLGIDLNGDFSVTTYGIVTGLEHAIQISSGTLGNVLANPTWSETWFTYWPGEGHQGSPWLASGGTILGSATVAIGFKDYAYPEWDTCIVEIAVSQSLFPHQFLVGDLVNCHITHFCGNDSINLTGVVIPAPGAVLLSSIGVCLVGWLRRRQAL